MGNEIMNDLPAFDASPTIEGNQYRQNVLESYLVMREYWQEIDLVFRIESPKIPSKADITKLGAMLEPYKRNPILLEMFIAVDEQYLDALSKEELERENLIRDEIYKQNAIKKPKTFEEGTEIANSVREKYSHLN